MNNGLPQVLIERVEYEYAVTRAIVVAKWLDGNEVRGQLEFRHPETDVAKP